MKLNFTGTFAKMPEMSFRAKLGWEYFFGGNNPAWACVNNGAGNWIVTDESLDLDNSIIFPDDGTLELWLEDTAKDVVANDFTEFLSNRVKPSWLVTDTVVDALLSKLGLEKESPEEDSPEEAPTGVGKIMRMISLCKGTKDKSDEE